MFSLRPTSDRYPHARRSDSFHVYSSETRGQVKVPDPYDWLEENSADVRTWTAAQEAITKCYLEQNIQSLLETFTASTVSLAFFVVGLNFGTHVFSMQRYRKVALLHFTLGFLNTGTFGFSHQSFDLETAFYIMRSANYIAIQELYDNLSPHRSA
jgi:hypothetical protein